MKPDQYLKDSYDNYGTFSITPGTLDTTQTPLAPFTSNQRGQSYTSGSSRKLSTFRYTYPEIQDWNQSPAQLRANVTAQFNALYNPSGAFVCIFSASLPYIQGLKISIP